MMHSIVHERSFRMTKSIMIDPGHGGSDPGAHGFGVREKDWALEISLYQYKRLKELGAKVGITRTGDRTLSATPRTRLIRNKYDICVSNHWNAFNGKARGIETIHSIYGGKELAQDLANELVSVTGLPLRRVFTRKNSSGTDYYYMHRMTGSTRTVIVEYGFIDNRQDNDWYKNKANFKRAAEAVIEVICKHVGIRYVAPSGHVTTSTSNKAGWVKNNAGWWWENADGTYPRNEWKKVKDIWYYFGKHGYISIGWRKIGDTWYYFHTNGRMLTGWQKINGKWYYLNMSGAMQTHWRKSAGDWYYLGSNGAMRTGLIKVNGKDYYLQRNGALITDEVIELEANKHGHLS